MNVIKVKSIAKINIGLIVKEKRDDGFHNLETIFYPLNDIFDVLTFAKSKSDEFQCNCDLPFDETNLIRRAKKILENASGKSLKVKINLEKKIPLGAGLGGGSSNAAATLKALNRLFELNFSNEKLSEFALALGSDVPYFLFAKPAFAELRGEKLTPIELKIKGVFLLVNPKIHISTARAFSRIRLSSMKKLDYKKIIEEAQNNFAQAEKYVQNSFEQFAFSRYPVIGGIKLDLIRNGAVFSCMTGTGSTVYGIFSEKEVAEKSSKLFKEKGFLTLISENHG